MAPCWPEERKCAVAQAVDREVGAASGLAGDLVAVEKVAGGVNLTDEISRPTLEDLQRPLRHPTGWVSARLSGRIVDLVKNAINTTFVRVPRINRSQGNGTSDNRIGAADTLRAVGISPVVDLPATFEMENRGWIRR